MFSADGGFSEGVEVYDIIFEKNISQFNKKYVTVYH